MESAYLSKVLLFGNKQKANIWAIFGACGIGSFCQMKTKTSLLLLWILIFCGGSLSLEAQSLSFQRDIQPIFAAKCVACHACYDAPCQLSLGSGSGLLRGATKLPVYDGVRTQDQATTRLFVDASDEFGWREKGFYSVLKAANNGSSAALLQRMLELGHSQQWPANAPLPKTLDIGINRQNVCPLPAEFNEFARKNPVLGMPFAVTGLTQDEYATLQNWLKQGAPMDEQPPQSTALEQRYINDWEQFFNARDEVRKILVSRWLYEHLFLAHLYFEGSESGHFFELVRSKTPSGQPIEPIATRRPNDDPGAEFYYRLRPIQGVIVHKTHITYALSPQKLERIQALFLGEDWSTHWTPNYGTYEQANPFLIFAAIPARARYQFMLDDAEYFVRTFILGPVCRGQIATDVIRDNFWVMFQDPQQDLFVTDALFRSQTMPLLQLPGLTGSLAELPLLWQSFRSKRNSYAQLRRERYAKAPAPDWSHLWQANDNALLSIFRHHDSASVHKGLVGGVPQTLWLIDFPLFERIYYLLVVNFDVFGSVAHQAQTRLHFDLLRNGAEKNFLRLMPKEQRQSLLDDWYQGSGQLRVWLDYPALDVTTPTGLALSKADARQEFALLLLERLSAINAAPDPINRCVQGNCHRPDLPPDLAKAEQGLARLSDKPASLLPVIKYLPEATLLRVTLPDGQREVYSLLRNRAHTNVAFMLGESYRYQPDLDTLTLYPGVLSSYPNFIFSLPASEAVQFVDTLQQVQDEAAFLQLVARWGIRRTHPEFWHHFHDLKAYVNERDPIAVGILDMNRYQDF
ncbi:fatty acid cis/trans isomerase CTI [Azomonas agilis]|uniref:Fatty acid cis/trans isomerase CTI n=2 Tax=Azomonas agilis TaxID=116849 RepID=A0A562J0N6_9GAMM|nr:fatty acid cis/trans isomerase CTI [Azomonas agilis]